jgi:hypothetical protein
MALSTELQELLATLKADVLPELVTAATTAAQDAVAATLPAAAVVVDPLIDLIDVEVQKLLGVTVTATAPTDAASVQSQLVKHVAALTVASGHSTTQAMATAKAATVQ